MAASSPSSVIVPLWTPRAIRPLVQKQARGEWLGGALSQIEAAEAHSRLVSAASEATGQFMQEPARGEWLGGALSQIEAAGAYNRLVSEAAEANRLLMQEARKKWLGGALTPLSQAEAAEAYSRLLSPAQSAERRGQPTDKTRHKTWKEKVEETDVYLLRVADRRRLVEAARKDHEIAQQRSSMAETLTQYQLGEEDAISILDSMENDVSVTRLKLVAEQVQKALNLRAFNEAYATEFRAYLASDEARAQAEVREAEQPAAAQITEETEEVAEAGSSAGRRSWLVGAARRKEGAVTIAAVAEAREAWRLSAERKGRSLGQVRADVEAAKAAVQAAACAEPEARIQRSAWVTPTKGVSLDIPSVSPTPRWADVWSDDED